MELIFALGFPIILLIGLTFFFMSEGIPAWITDLFITQSPLYAMKNLQKEFN